MCNRYILCLIWKWLRTHYMGSIYIREKAEVVWVIFELYFVASGSCHFTHFGRWSYLHNDFFFPLRISVFYSKYSKEYNLHIYHIFKAVHTAKLLDFYFIESPYPPCWEDGHKNWAGKQSRRKSWINMKTH